jgi:hypothetical protein
MWGILFTRMYVRNLQMLFIPFKDSDKIYKIKALKYKQKSPI